MSTILKAEEKPKRIRKPRRNFAEERARVVQYCKISIDIMENFGPPDPEFMKGQIAALKSVLREMGEVQ